MKKNFSTYVAILTAIITGIGVYYQVFYRESTSLNIERSSVTLLTRPLNIEGLNVSYRFHDTIDVKNLWQTVYLIKNTGDKTILGEGFEGRNIRNSNIPLKLVGCQKLLSASISKTNSGVSLNGEKLFITQWRRGEYVEITIISEGKSFPVLKINDRDISDAEITYSVYSPEQDNKNEKIIDSFPSGIKSIMKWGAIIALLIMSIAIIAQLPKQMKGAESKGAKITSTILFVVLVLFMLMPLLWMF